MQVHCFKSVSYLTFFQNQCFLMDQLTTWLSWWCCSHRIITLEATGCRFCKFFAGAPHNEGPLCPLFNITRSVSWLPNQFRKHCQFKQEPLKVEIFKILGKGGEPYIGGNWHFIGGLDNSLENMLCYLSFISLWVAIYTFPITLRHKRPYIRLYGNL